MNSCEEGLGNLKGTRQLFKDYNGRIKQFVTLDSRIDTMANLSVGSHRYKVNVKTPGGHSYSAFGNKNAIVEFAPMEFYEKYVLTPENTVYELLKKRSKDFTVGLMEDRKMFETVIPYWETENGKLKRLELLPVAAVMKGNQSEIGLPIIAKDDSFMERIAGISAPYGVTMKKENDVYVCKW